MPARGPPQQELEFDQTERLSEEGFELDQTAGMPEDDFAQAAGMPEDDFAQDTDDDSYWT